MENRHIFEVHPVYAGDQVKREEYSRNYGQLLQSVIRLLLKDQLVVLMNVLEPILVPAEEPEAVTHLVLEVCKVSPPLSYVEGDPLVYLYRINAVELVFDHYIHASDVLFQIKNRPDGYRVMILHNFIAQIGYLFPLVHKKEVVFFHKLGHQVKQE